LADPDYTAEVNATVPRLAQNPLGSSQIAPLAEPELDRVAAAVDRAVEIRPTPADLDVSFVDVPLASDHSLAAIEPLQHRRSSE
jgi:hypothetical protein